VYTKSSGLFRLVAKITIVHFPNWQTGSRAVIADFTMTTSTTALSSDE